MLVAVNFLMDPPEEQPAFVCEGFSVQVDAEKIQNSLSQMLRPGKSGSGDPSRSAVLYLSRRQLKNSTSNVINIQIDVKGINQKASFQIKFIKLLPRDGRGLTE